MLTIVTAPTVEPLDLEEVEDHLRISETASGEEDTLIYSYIKAVRRQCERIQNRAYLHQTWKYVLTTWPNGEYIELPRPPLVSVTHVKYYSTGGTANTMSTGLYYVDTDREPGRVHLNYGESWPSDTLRPGTGVEIQYVAGYGSAASSVPEEIKLALKLLIGHFYEHREASIDRVNVLVQTIPGAKELLWLDRVVPV